MAKAYATYSIKQRSSLGTEAVLSVESPSGYFSCGIVFVGRGQDVQGACYAEADRRAAVHGLCLESLRMEGV